MGNVEFIPMILAVFVTIITFLLCCFGWLCYNVNYEEFLYNISKYLVSKNKELMTFIEDWNANYFAHYNMYASCPQTLNYIQIVMDRKCVLVLQNHLYPFEEHYLKHKNFDNKSDKNTNYCKNNYCFKYNLLIACYRVNCSIPGSLCSNIKCENRMELPHHYHHYHENDINNSGALLNLNNSRAVLS